MNRKERRRQGKLNRRDRRSGRDAPGGAAAESAFVPAALGQALSFLQAGDPKQAWALYRQVLSVQPDHPEALNLGGVAAFQSGRAKQGLKLVRAAVAAQPRYVDARNNLGNMLNASGQLDQAEAAYRAALEIEPGYVDAHYNLGIVLEARARPERAEAAYRSALELRPDFFAAWFNLGNTLKTLGKLDEAMASYRRAIEIRPEYAEAQNNLGSTLRELERLDEAEAAYRRALEIRPDVPDTHYNLGIVLQELGRLDEAVAAYEAARDMDPEHAGALVNLGYALQQSGRLDDAVAAYRRAIAVAPHDIPGTHINLGDLYLQRGDPRAALKVCRAYLEARPGDSGVLAFQAIVLDELGARDELRALLDFDRLIRMRRVTAPQGFSGLTAFNAALAEHVLAHPTLVYAPASHATRQGKHSGELLVEPKGPVAALEGIIREAVADYRRALPVEPGHPFLANRPKRFGLNAWAVVLQAQGHQIPHNHPSAWLSGVYYVQLPDIVRGPGQGQAGWIEFGRPPQHFHGTVEPEVRAFQPEEGLMLLFPSYVYHRTVPFEGAGTRISIAFDVLPEG
jgi:tetratricopeptide (TPR) repeat protein